MICVSVVTSRLKYIGMNIEDFSGPAKKLSGKEVYIWRTTNV